MSSKVDALHACITVAFFIIGIGGVIMIPTGFVTMVLHFFHLAGGTFGLDLIAYTAGTALAGIGMICFGLVIMIGGVVKYDT